MRIISKIGPRTELSLNFALATVVLGLRLHMCILTTLVLGLSCYCYFPVPCGHRTEMTSVFLATLVWS